MKYKQLYVMHVMVFQIMTFVQKCTICIFNVEILKVQVICSSEKLNQLPWSNSM